MNVIALTLHCMNSFLPVIPHSCSVLQICFSMAIEPNYQLIFTNNDDNTKDIEHRIAIARSATIAPTNIWKDRNILVQTKKRLLQSLVFSIAAYGAKCWVLKMSDRKRLESFELWCYRRILPISRTKKETNESVLKKLNCDNRLLDSVYSHQLSFIGHILRHECLQGTLLLGMVPGSRGRGRPKTRLSDHLKEICGLTMVEMHRSAQHRENWRRTVTGATGPRRPGIEPTVTDDDQLF